MDEVIIPKSMGNNFLSEYIDKIVEEKYLSGAWDKTAKGQPDNLVSNFLYEYSTSIEKLTKGNIKAEEVVNRLAENMGVLRLGDFKKGLDDNIQYEKVSVTSKYYKQSYRVGRLGAQTISYKDIDGKDKDAVVLFDKRQKEKIDGKLTTLSGINLKNINDIRATFFHEMTHVLEKCRVKASKLERKDIIYENGNHTYINSIIDPTLSKKTYEIFVSNLDRLLKCDKKITFRGITTIEPKINSYEDRVIHNEISEGTTELISRKALEMLGAKPKDNARYKEARRIMGEVFERRGLSETITTYLTEPYKLTRELENKRVGNLDMLHFMSEHVRSSKIKQLFTIFTIDENGNIKPSPFQKIADKIDRMFGSESIKALSEGTSQIQENKQDEKKSFIDEIKTKPSEENKITTKREKTKDIDKELNME